MKTTTIRVDLDAWEEVVRRSQELGIAQAEYIRGAIHQRIGSHAHTDRLTALERRVENEARRTDGIARVLVRVVAGRARQRPTGRDNE